MTVLLLCTAFAFLAGLLLGEWHGRDLAARYRVRGEHRISTAEWAQRQADMVDDPLPPRRAFAEICASPGSTAAHDGATVAVESVSPWHVPPTELRAVAARLRALDVVTAEWLPVPAHVPTPVPALLFEQMLFERAPVLAAIAGAP